MADDEKTLVAKAREGDRKAFGELVQRHHRKAWRLAVHLLSNVSEADDVVQDAFFRALRGIERFDGRSEFGTWLHRIVVNLSLNAIRGRKRTTPLSGDDPRLGLPTGPGSDPSRAAEDKQTYEKLSVAIDGLSLTLRTTLVLVAIQGVSHKDAAEILGCSEGTIAWRVHEARRRLRGAMGDEAPASESSKAEDGSGGKDETDEGWD
jgi:RNA polymerase sigma-70 factor (ECF subfamily)